MNKEARIAERILLRHVSRLLKRSGRGNRCSEIYAPRANCCEMVKQAKAVAAANTPSVEGIVH